jgi:DNA-binding NtrC family response regulator
MSILYIEDDQGLWALVRHALDSISCDVIGAHSLKNARQLMADQKDLTFAIIDYELPDGKGVEFLEEYSNVIPCIMLTGVGNEELVVSCLQNGAKDYLVKDVQGKYLLRLPRVIKRIQYELELERQNSQKAIELEKTKNRLKIVFDSSPDLMIITDTSGVIFQMSEACSELYQLEPIDYINSNLEALIPKDVINQLFLPMGGSSSNKVTTRLNQQFDVLANCQLLNDDIYLIVFKDQTEKLRASKAIAQVKEVVSENRRLHQLNDQLAKNIENENSTSIIGNSPVIHELLTCIKSVAETDATVLVLGETGTGKELIADEIHRHSLRKKEVIVKLNCASIPSELIESELFGYEKGAFTGAKSSHKGRFAQADGGTLFLDEIGELDMTLQSKLLRVLQEGEVLPLGGSVARLVDVRVIAATNSELEKMVEQGAFRADLYYRLNVVPIHAPTLQQRIEDIPLLALYFFQKYKARYQSKPHMLTDRHITQLINRAWPGNVRELQNIIERFVVLGKIGTSKETTENEVVLELSENENMREQDMPLESIEKNHILKVLKICDWIISGKKGAAEKLGLNPSTLRFRMQKLGISRDKRQTY